MSAIDDLKEDRAEVIARLQQEREAKQNVTAERAAQLVQYDETLTEIQTRIDRLGARRDRLTQAIRDLGDAWTPAP